MRDYPGVTVEGRTLMGPGPSNVHPRVLRALAVPTLGHLDPEFLGIMNLSKELLAKTFETESEFTIPVSGTGSAGMETALVNFIEPGDKVLVCESGLFGQRMADIVTRCGGDLAVVQAEWGRIIEPEDVVRALESSRADIVAIVHAETSTGVLQPLKEVAEAAREHGALLIVDAVTSLGGAPVRVDATGIDVCYSGTQKCLSCPPGLAPITIGNRARAKLDARRTKVQSWYLDLTMLRSYWGKDRFYHHTAPVNMIYALYESLRIIHEEGLEARFARHVLHSDALKAGLSAMGLRLFAQEGYRAPMLTSVEVPAGVDDARVRQYLLTKYRLEIGGGLGPLKGRIWRVGLMGHSCTRANVMLFLSALEDALAFAGHRVEPGAGISAAARHYEEEAEDEVDE
ncbi:MAG: alanine--glyoxylate aminotransferase family protein [Firmicutes bacterium]|nr:alanine--glyoxylate aminotransferase family protein [Bacillota bacterium]MDH7495237.1 alanine--glyoxylate aminotransferase family protein [Bacillota bacterium]